MTCKKSCTTECPPRCCSSEVTPSTRALTLRPRTFAGCPSVCRIVCASECPKYCCPAEKPEVEAEKAGTESSEDDEMDADDDEYEDEDMDESEEQHHNDLVLNKMKELRLRERARLAQEAADKLAIAKARKEEQENRSCPASCSSQCSATCCRLCTIPGHKPHFCCKLYYRQAFPDCPAICEEKCDSACPRRCCGPGRSISG